MSGSALPPVYSVESRVRHFVPLLVCLAAASAAADTSPYSERVFTNATLVLKAQVQRVAADGKAVLSVQEALRGAAPGVSVEVNLSAAPAGTWPAVGESVLLALKVTAEGYALAARLGAMAPAEPAVVSRLRALLGTPSASPAPAGPPLPEDTAAPPALPKTDELGPAAPRKFATVKVTEALDSQAAAADVIAIGSVVEVALGREQGDRAVLRFLPEEHLKGGGLPDLIAVHVPAPEPHYQGELPAFRIGRHCLFLASRPRGSGLDLVSPYFGTYYLEDDAAVARFKEKLFATDVMKAIAGTRGPIITTVQALAAIWEEAWNQKNLARLIACYSRNHDFYRMYAAGGQYRMALERKLRDYPAAVRLKIERVNFPLPERAEVFLDMTLELEGAAERRGAIMQLVREDGEWRILDEGF